MRMQIALNTGGKIFLFRKTAFLIKSERASIHKEILFFDDLFEIAFKECVFVFLCNFRDKERSARFDLRSVLRERFPKQTLDSVPFNAFSILLSHANSVMRFLCRKIHERYRMRKRSLSAFEHFFDFFVFFKTETAFCHFRYAETCFLPLFLRRLMTFLPPVVFMRLRKP